MIEQCALIRLERVKFKYIGLISLKNKFKLIATFDHTPFSFRFLRVQLWRRSPQVRELNDLTLSLFGTWNIDILFVVRLPHTEKSDIDRAKCIKKRMKICVKD